MNDSRSRELHGTIPRDLQGEIESLALDHPTWADYQNRWGLMLLAQGRAAEARDVFDRCLEINPRYAWATVNRIQAMALAGKREEAAELLDRTSVATPGVVPFVAAFLDLMASKGSRGIQRLTELPAGLGERPDVKRLSSALHHCEDPGSGDESWQAIQGEYADVPSGLVVPWDADGLVEPRLVTFVPGMHELFLELSNLAAKRGSLRAAAGLADMIRLFWWDEAVYFSQHGFLANLEGRSDVAVEFYDRAVQGDPGSPRAHIALAYHWSSMGEVEEARHSLAEALELAPKYADLHYQMGLLQRATFETDLAVESFRSALRINPDYIMARMQEAASLFERSDWEASCDSYGKVIEAGLVSADIYTQLGQAYTEMNRLDEAEEAFASAAELVPDEPRRKRTA